MIRTAVLTNSWALYCSLHGLRGPGTSETTALENTLKKRLKCSAGWAKWAPGLCAGVGRAIRQWIETTPEERREAEREDQATIRVLSTKRVGNETPAVRELTRREAEFRQHCEHDHVVFRRDCQICLEAAMRGHQHFRQKHQHQNALCLNVDLIGPWKAGADHVLHEPARHVLVATLGVPIFKHGKPIPLSEGVVPTDPEVPPPGDPVLQGELGPDLEEEPGNAPAESGEPPFRDSDELRVARERQERQWRSIAEKLQAPVKIHEILFTEPLSSKKGPEVLRAIQRIHARILLLGLSVRRMHSDQGREFHNRAVASWCASRDICQTFAVPSDPRSNGRVESAVGQVKNGVRALLRSQTQLGTSLWPCALRQYTAQRFQASMTCLGGPIPKRPLPPFGTTVLVKNRAWSRKTPYASKAVKGVVVCPAASVPNCSVLRMGDSTFYLAPVVYQHVRKPVQFVGEIIHDPPDPPPRRVRGKTEGEHVVRGESFAEDCGLDDGEDGFYEPSLPDQGADAGSGGEDVAGEGRDTDWGHPATESGEEDERVLGSGGEEESSRRLGPEGPGIRNLWCEHVQCELCEGTCIDSHGYCSECGVWTGGKYDVQQSEEQAAVLLNKGGKISRTDVNRLLELSMTTWKPTSRKCDRQAAMGSAQGWTLGAYVYGNKVGVTRETYRRPLLTQLLNQYVRQEAPTAHWAALRVTCDFQASPHRDKNEPGSENVIVPVSWFKRGNLWVEGECKLGCIPSNRDVDGKMVEGYIDGGADRVCAFNPRLRHAVEPADGKRRVLVAYTPRLLNRLPPQDVQFLADVSFPRGERMEADPKGGEGGEEQRPSTSTGNFRKGEHTGELRRGGV